MTQTNHEESHYIVEEAPVILWMTDADGRHIYYNRLWRDFLGMDMSEAIDERAWLEALHPEDRDSCLTVIKQHMHDHSPIKLVYRLRNSQGQYCWMLDKSHPVYRTDGSFMGYIGAVADISEQKRIEEALEHMNEDLERANTHGRLLRQMNEQIQVCSNLGEVHAVINHYMPRLFANTAGALYLLNRKTRMLEQVTVWGDMAAVSAFDPEACWALRQGKIYSVTEKAKLFCQHLGQCPDGGYLCIPLQASGEVLGLIHLQNYNQLMDDMRYHELLRNTAENLSLALSSFMLREALQDQSVRDPLTNLYNRRYMQESLEREVARAQRNNQNLAVVMIDLDHFKAFNDKHGHATGDQVLRTLADYFIENLRGEDIAARYGGEEFTLVLANISKADATRRLETLRAGVHALTVGGEQPVGKPLSISAGVAIYPEHGERPDALLKQADIALYQAKAAGRDQVCVAD